MCFLSSLSWSEVSEKGVRFQKAEWLMLSSPFRVTHTGKVKVTVYLLFMEHSHEDRYCFLLLFLSGFQFVFLFRASDTLVLMRMTFFLFLLGLCFPHGGTQWMAVANYLVAGFVSVLFDWNPSKAHDGLVEITGLYVTYTNMGVPWGFHESHNDRHFQFTYQCWTVDWLMTGDE
jgi:hypothetical protein